MGRSIDHCLVCATYPVPISFECSYCPLECQPLDKFYVNYCIVPIYIKSNICVLLNVTSVTFSLNKHHIAI